MFTEAQCRERASEALHREAECVEPDVRAEWLENARVWTSLAAMAEWQDDLIRAIEMTAERL